MRRRYILAPEAALDLVKIWRYVGNNATIEMADRVVSVIREKIVYLAGRPGAGHWRKDLTDEPVRFFSIYSYLIGPRRIPCRWSPFSMAAAMLRGFSMIDCKRDSAMTGATTFQKVVLCETPLDPVASRSRVRPLFHSGELRVVAASHP